MEKTVFFYDGDCGFCRNVSRHYRKAKGHEKVIFVDITNKEVFERFSKGLTLKECQKAVHARLPNGEIKVGVDAMITLWKTFPNYKILGDVFDHKLTKPIAQVFYRVIAKNRKRIPKVFLKD